MKICVIGNSHIGALKGGFDRLARVDQPPPDVTFFGAPSTTLKHLRAADGRLFTHDAVLSEHLRKTSGGAAELALDPYEVLVVLGGQLHLTTALKLFLSHRPAQFNRGDGEVVSEAAFAATLDDTFSRSTAVHVLKLIAPLCKRLIVAPAPLRNELEIGKAEFPYLADPSLGQPAIDWMVATCVGAWQRIADRFRAELLEQPKDTIGPSGLTKAEFASRRTYHGGRWIDEPDTTHANAAYGERVLGQLYAHLGVARQAVASA